MEDRITWPGALRASRFGESVSFRGIVGITKERPSILRSPIHGLAYPCPCRIMEGRKRPHRAEQREPPTRGPRARTLFPASTAPCFLSVSRTRSCVHVLVLDAAC